MEQVSSFIIHILETTVRFPGTHPIFQSKRKVISVLFPYAARRAQDGQLGMIDAISHVALKSASGGFVWRRIGDYTTWLDESSPPYLNHAIALASPCKYWMYWSHNDKAPVARWAAAVLETPYSDAVGQSVVDVLLRIAFNRSLRPQIPVQTWAWLKRRPPLPPLCSGRYWASSTSAFCYIRGIGDIEILKSYLLLVWSEWEYDPWVWKKGLIERDFGGIGMWCHREDLIKRLDHVLGQLDRGLEYFKQHNPTFDDEDDGGTIESRKELYGRLKKELLEMDKKATRTLSRMALIIIFDE